MIVYSEEKTRQKSSFIKTILDENGNTVSTRKVYIPLFQMEKEGVEYFVLYTDQMKVISDTYEYLNFTIRESSPNSRKKAAYALRLLYCFLSLSGITVHQITEKEFKDLLYFLRGISSNPKQYSIKTQRSAATVNGYLSVYRSFFFSRGIKCKSLFKSHYVTTEHAIEGNYHSTVERKRYDNNLQDKRPNEETVPKYIGPEDFKKLYKLALDKQDKQTELIMHLMYGYGLRLGECLGLTIEDIQETFDNGQLVPVLYLRNRKSDKNFQFAKGLMHVVNPKQYRSHDYQLSRWKIIITYELYEQLLSLIEETHASALKNYADNYASGTADIVSVRDKPESNHYVFINRYGRILNDQTWNNLLKYYFNEAGIPIDYDIREKNLSHRFRHGFAMFHARFSEHPVDALALSKMMRHGGVSSTMVYYNPTPEDEFKIKTEFQQELYNLIPELKEGLNGNKQ